MFNYMAEEMWRSTFPFRPILNSVMELICLTCIRVSLRIDPESGRTVYGKVMPQPVINLYLIHLNSWVFFKSNLHSSNIKAMAKLIPIFLKSLTFEVHPQFSNAKRL